jgi:hypothetical protein
MVWLKDKMLSPVAKAYLKEIQANKEIIIRQNFGWISNHG